MNVFGEKKKAEVIYEHQKLAVLVAVSNENNSIVRDFFKKYKGKNLQPSDTVEVYKMIVDEEFGSLKIDFSKNFEFFIKDLKLFLLK
tara:strand:+ start:286 stop:546 length:261 start_codon:yes stop_codon:yes gene_type:complete